MITGWLKRTSIAPAATASSTLYSAEVTKATWAGKLPGRAASAFGPTVYSVARTPRVVSACWRPPGSTIRAVVPCRKNSVSWRVPSASVTTLPPATWIGTLAARSMVVTCESSATRATSGKLAKSRQGACHGALRGQEAGVLVTDRQGPAPVDREVEHPVGPARASARTRRWFAIRHDDPGQRSAVAPEHPAPEHGRPLGSIVPVGTPVWIGFAPV